MVLCFITICVYVFCIISWSMHNNKRKTRGALTLSLPVSDPSYVTLCTWRHPWVTTRLLSERHYVSRAQAFWRWVTMLVVTHFAKYK